MPKFDVELERRFVQFETATITIEAASPAEAKKLAKSKMTSDAIADQWEASDSKYDQYMILEVSPQK